MKPTPLRASLCLKPEAKARPHPPGFALIITLSLMILLTVVAVGLLSLSSISLRSSGRNEAMQTARANARLALMLAINQIQSATGPDQRVTIPADQRPKSSDGRETAAAAGNLRWTGVYRSWDPASTTRPTPQFVSWLVSGEAAKTATATLADTAAANPVQLVGPGTLGSSNTEGRISVPAITIQQNKKPAKLAWWVGDQAAKAALATPELSPDKSSLGVARGNLQSAPRSAIESSQVGTTKPFAAVAIDDPRVRRVTSWRQSEILASDPAAPRGLFHDLVSGSTGMLTNVVAGGFRKDLSMQLEPPSVTGSNPPVLTGKNPYTKSLYTVGSNTNKENGINFLELAAYYNSYRNVIRSGAYKYSTGGNLASGTPYMMVGAKADAASSSLANCGTDDNFFFKQPTVISYQLVLSFKAYPVTTGSGATAKTVQRVYVVADPIITLWNPLDVPVVVPTTAYISVSYWQIPYTLVVTKNGTPAFASACPLASTLSGTTKSSEEDMHYLTLELGKAANTVLRPGEVVKFSQKDKDTTKLEIKDTIWVDATPGFKFGGGGFATPLKDLDGKTLDIVEGDKIAYTAVANNITAGQKSGRGHSVNGQDRHTRHYSITHHSVVLGMDNDANAIAFGGMYLDWDFGDKRLRPSSQLRTSSTGGSKPSKDLLSADKFPDVFKPITPSDARSLSFNQLQTETSPFLLISFDAKTETGSATGTRFLSRFNPKAHHVDFYNLSKEERDMLPYEFRGEAMTSWVNRSLDLSDNGSGFFGGGMNGEYGTGSVITHSIPREPIVSLAALQNSFANGFEFIRPQTGTKDAPLNDREPLLPQISHAIGNSLAPAVIAADKTEGSLPGSRPLADHSYLANKALWDDWFFSGIAPQFKKTFAGDKDQKTVASEFFAGTSKLPVVRYRPQLDGQDSTTLINSLFTGSNATTTAVDLIASYLRVDGMFNVNSTSIEAWKAILGGLKGRPVVVCDDSGKETIAATNNANTPVTGILQPVDLVANGGGNLAPGDKSQWVGRRELTEGEIDQLAKALVVEIRRRGPFLSLADFVNRRPGSDLDLAKSGAIQSALDSKEVSINKAFNRAIAPAKDTFAFKQAEEGPMAYGIPGYVKQGDILTPIAPILSVRSDSFIVRAYGESVDAGGNVIARAWCEAVVERDRNYVDPADSATTAVTALTKATNRTFGRRYQIASFRWLSPSEV